MIIDTSIPSWSIGTYDGDITVEEDGTYTVDLKPWSDIPIVGLTSKDAARQAAHAVHEAMSEYSFQSGYD